MSTLTKNNVFSQISIAAQIIDGSIKINSVTEFENVLRLFPNDPALIRAYADLLVKKKLLDDAVKSYGKAAQLFIDSGMTLQAVVSKSLQWKISPPSNLPEIRSFFASVQKAGYHETPVNALFNKLSYPAMVAILYPLVKISLPAGTIVKKVGDEETDLYFIVSGALRATTYQPVKANGETVYKKLTVHLSENDFFGEIYPFEERQRSQSYYETLSRNEVIKIPKISLMKVCVKYPDVETALAALYKIQSGYGETENMQKKRMADRQKLPIKVNLKIHPNASDEQSLTLAGYSRDISIGGICVVLNSDYQRIPSFNKYIKEAGVQIGFPSEELTLNVTGKVVWSREITIAEEKTIALGMQFQEMSPKSRGMLLGFANSLEFA